jgi:hypothetical protein
LASAAHSGAKNDKKPFLNQTPDLFVAKQKGVCRETLSCACPGMEIGVSARIGIAPGPEWGRNHEPLNAQRLANLLKPFGIAPGMLTFSQWENDGRTFPVRARATSSSICRIQWPDSRLPAPQPALRERYAVSLASRKTSAN